MVILVRELAFQFFEICSLPDESAIEIWRFLWQTSITTSNKMNRLTNLLNLNYQPFNFWNSWYFLRILLKFLNGSHQQRSWIENLNALITVKKFNHDLHLFISHINPTISSLHRVKLITSSLMNNQLQLQSPRPWYPQTFQLEHRSANSVTDHSWNTGS